MEQKKNNDHLVRQLTLLPLFFIIVANMVGSGIFTTSGFIMQDIQSPLAMLLCWFIGGLLALTGALCYGELGAMFPASGGDYVFLRESFGKRTAFLSGWISLWVGFSAP
ncbi:MAG: amino acid permease, partial [Deltaproteobacteria bacterium]|nr:amino acid permease [Deltaproteobacteria bacterium]